MDKLIEKKKEYREEFRQGIKLNVEAYLGTLDTLYLADLDASVSSFDDYEAISAETYNDYKVVCAKLEVLEKCEYLTIEETDEMRKCAAEMRLKKLEELEHEENRS